MRYLIASPLVLVALCLVASAASAGEPCCPKAVCEPPPDCSTCRLEHEVTLDLGGYTKYVWRGILTTDGSVAQPSIDFSSHGFGLNVWANLDLQDVNGTAFDFSEVDLTASYGFTLGKLDFNTGVVTYLFPTGGDQTTEIFAGVAWDVPLSPTLTVWKDVGVVKGTYVALSGSYVLEDPFCLGACRGLSPEFDASIGWGSRDHNRVYYGHDGSGLADLTLGLSVPYRISRWATVRASVHWASLLDQGIRAATPDPDNLWFGIGISLSF